jgi:hypothetical protein
MSTHIQTTPTSTGLNDDFIGLALFCVLGLLASFYLMTYFPMDEGFLAAWL